MMMEIQVDGETANCRPSLPPWMQRRKTENKNIRDLKSLLEKSGLHSVCQSAGCPNLSECFQQRNVTFILLGDSCTRHCRFCKIALGEPIPVDPGEPGRVANAVCQLQLKHAVITSVTRDDLKDGGAGHFADTIRAIRLRSVDTTIEVLVPDFQGSFDCIRKVLEAQADVFGHNIETVSRLYFQLRPEADYSRSLTLLKKAKLFSPQTRIKSGLMLGLGERHHEVLDSLMDLRDSGCQAVFMGQYLRPSVHHYPVQEYIEPKRFLSYRQEALKMGFEWVSAGPYVRSSYHASEWVV